MMNDLIEKLPDEVKGESFPEEITAILSDPQLFVSKIRELGTSLKEDADLAKQIKEAGTLKKLFISQRKTDLILRFNKRMTEFYHILTAVSFLTKGNSALLLGFYNSLCEDEKANNLEGNLFYTMAKDNIKKAIDSAENDQLREKALKIALVSSKNNEEKVDNYKENTKKRISEAIALVKEHIDLRAKKTSNCLSKTESILTEKIDDAKKQIDDLDYKTKNENEKIHKDIIFVRYVLYITIALSIINFVLYFLK